MGPYIDNALSIRTQSPERSWRSLTPQDIAFRNGNQNCVNAIGRLHIPTFSHPKIKRKRKGTEPHKTHKRCASVDREKDAIILPRPQIDLRCSQEAPPAYISPDV